MDVGELENIGAKPPPPPAQEVDWGILGGGGGQDDPEADPLMVASGRAGQRGPGSGHEWPSPVVSAVIASAAERSTS